ncbi:MAG: endonuclease [Flavobacteriaceae bacterium]|nr:endonuclease [Flavobacteriaceae bacterium]
MKQIIVILGILFILSCSKDSPSPSEPNVPTEAKPVAKDDEYTLTEDEEYIITAFLDNDTLENNARLNSFDTTTTKGGSVLDNRNGTFTYTPPKAFVGTDTFTYTICDYASPKACATATITLNIADEGTPIANDDSILAVQNSAIQVKNLTENDNLVDDSSLASVTSASSQGGQVELRNDGSVWYTPADGFVGSDSFEYTLCDDDSPEKNCATATVTVTVKEAIAFNIPAELKSYYSGLAFAEVPSFVKEQLTDHCSGKHTTILSYGQRHQYLYDADADLANAANVILMYTSESRDEREYASGSNSHSPQTFNTEHVFPQSRLQSDGAVTDLHHLRTCDADINSQRSNYSFVEGSGSYSLVGSNGWYPGDEWKGDVARMVFYLHIRYGEVISKVGDVNLFLKWNKEDPVSDFEKQRQTVIMGAQGNRNPFIDNPYLATLIWGGDVAENTWE